LFPVEIKRFSAFHSIRTGCGLHSACFMNMRNLLPACEEVAADYPVLSSSSHPMQERMRERIPPPYQTPSLCGLLIKLLVILLSRIYSEIVLGPN
jgi:hypothetical protein